MGGAPEVIRNSLLYGSSHLSLPRLLWKHELPLLRDRSQEFATLTWSRKIFELVHSRVASSASAAPDQAGRVESPAESQTRFPDSPITLRAPLLPAGST